ncbi:SCF ubiquitin ligase complex subunit [Quaeritorhiza haematococci]|nr:SCF ubiquitin ligase complex subunit [Quaeritorhiza haematococci]
MASSKRRRRRSSTPAAAATTSPHSLSPQAVSGGSVSMHMNEISYSEAATMHQGIGAGTFGSPPKMVQSALTHAPPTPTPINEPLSSPSLVQDQAAAMMPLVAPPRTETEPDMVEDESPNLDFDFDDNKTVDDGDAGLSADAVSVAEASVGGGGNRERERLGRPVKRRKNHIITISPPPRPTFSPASLTSAYGHVHGSEAWACPTGHSSHDECTLCPAPPSTTTVSIGIAGGHDTLSEVASTLAPELLTQIFSHLAQTGYERDLTSAARVNKQWSQCALRVLWRNPILDHERSWKDFLHVMGRARARAGTRWLECAENIGSLNIASVGSRGRRRTPLDDDKEDDGWGKAQLQSLMAAPRRLRSSPQCVTYGEFVRELNLSELADAVLDRQLIQVASSCPNLRVLNVERCRRLTSRGLKAIITSCKMLVHLDLTGLDYLDDSAYYTIFGSGVMPNLINLSVTLSSVVSGDGLLAALAHMPNLQRLWVQHCDVLRDEHIERMTHLCRNISDLSLLDCRSCTDATAFYLAVGLGPTLRQLTIGLSDLIQDDGIVTLVEACPNLENLTLALVRQITDISITAIGDHLPHLRELGIFSSPHVTNTSISHVATRCTNIKRLCLYDCPGLTVDCMVPVAKHLQKLEYLNIEHCKIFEATQELRVLRRRCEHFVANRDLLNSLHLADLMALCEDRFGLCRQVHLMFDIL